MGEHQAENTGHFTRSAGSAHAQNLGAGRPSSTCSPTPTPHRPLPKRASCSGHRWQSSLTQSRKVENGCFLNQTPVEPKIWGGGGCGYASRFSPSRRCSRSSHTFLMALPFPSSIFVASECSPPPGKSIGLGIKLKSRDTHQ